MLSEPPKCYIITLLVSHVSVSFVIFFRFGAEHVARTIKLNFIPFLRMHHIHTHAIRKRLQRPQTPERMNNSTSYDHAHG